MRCIKITFSDDRMDCRDMFYDPINPLPKKCPKCGFPDLNHIPNPYFLVKSRTMSPNELAGAENGNFLIRDRIRRLLDLLFPDLCAYFPTSFKGTTQQTPWFLAVPQNQVATAKVNSAISRCNSCGEPRSAHPGSQWTESLLQIYPSKDGWSCELDFEIVKSATWGSCESGWDQWISRNIYISVRLLHLFKKIKARGFYEATCKELTLPDKDESAWIKEKLQILKQAGIPIHPEGTLSKEDSEWLQGFLRVHAPAVKANLDISAAERFIKSKLPKSYIDFIKSVGPMSFNNVDEQEGFTASVLSPDKLGTEGRIYDFEDDKSKMVNILTFATTNHGDFFCFDIQNGKKEYAVCHFKHEYNILEPYADNFAACIKRFTGSNYS